MSDQINWRPDLSAAVAEAQKTNLPVALEFYLETWPHCARMVRETHADPAVVSLLNEKFIPVRLEGRSHVDLAQKFNVRAVPTTLILSPQEQEIVRFDGFKTGGEYIEELQKIK